MWKAELRIEDSESNMQSFCWENEELGLAGLVGLVNKKAREVSKQSMLVMDASGNDSIIYRDGPFVVGFANFWEV